VTFKIEFQYKHEGAVRPEDVVQDDPIRFESGEFCPLPAVGDTVTYAYGGQSVARKVLTRHFAFLNDWCCVNLVVTDVPSGEMSARLKE